MTASCLCPPPAEPCSTCTGGGARLGGTVRGTRSGGLRGAIFRWKPQPCSGPSGLESPFHRKGRPTAAVPGARQRYTFSDQLWTICMEFGESATNCAIPVAESCPNGRRNAENACAVSELHALSPKLAGKRCMLTTYRLFRQRVTSMTVNSPTLRIFPLTSPLLQ